MWDGSRIVSRSGIHYAIVEVTKLVYGGGIPSEIGLRAPISIERVTFSSPSLTLATLEDKPTTLHLQMNVACNDVKATNQGSESPKR